MGVARSALTPSPGPPKAVITLLFSQVHLVLQLGPHCACHPPLPRKVEGRLHITLLFQTSKHPPPFGKPAAELRMRMWSRHRAKECLPGHGMHVGRVVQGHLAKRCLLRGQGARDWGGEAGTCEGSCIRKHEYKKEEAPQASGRKPIHQHELMMLGPTSPHPEFSQPTPKF